MGLSVKIRYLLFSIFSAFGAGVYLGEAAIRKNFWFPAIASLILSTIVFTSLVSIGVYIATRKAKALTRRIVGLAFAFCSLLALSSIYYGVFINPIYRYEALAIPTLLIFGLFLLAIAWAESAMFRQLHVHREETEKKKITLTLSQLFSGVVSISCVLLTIILISGTIGRKGWVITVPVSIFTVVILLSYFFYGLVVVKNFSCNNNKL